jgi:hypothetical protein
MKFTFKTEKSTGRYRTFHSDYHYVKLNKCVVGNISDEEPFKIHLMVIKNDVMEDGNKNCTWKWITLKKESSSLQEAKDFLNKHFSATFQKHIEEWQSKLILTI